MADMFLIWSECNIHSRRVGMAYSDLRANTPHSPVCSRLSEPDEAAIEGQKPVGKSGLRRTHIADLLPGVVSFQQQCGGTSLVVSGKRQSAPPDFLARMTAPATLRQTPPNASAPRRHLQAVTMISTRIEGFANSA